MRRKAASGAAIPTLCGSGSSKSGSRAMPGPLPLCHLDGQRPPLREARISPLDRSFLFGDGVYEVIQVYGGRPFRIEAHLSRLTRSLAALRIRDPHATGWRALVEELAAANGGGAQYVYLHVSRGAE